MMRMSKPSLSVIVSMQSKPLSLGKGPMKSIAIESQRLSGIGRGWRGPNGLVVQDLFRWQSVQAGTYAFSRSHLILGQKKESRSEAYDFGPPKWPSLS